MKEVVGIFAKSPVPGRVKTRLVPPLTPPQAARVYEASLRDVIRRAAASMDVCIFHDTEPGAERYFRARYAGIPILRQTGRDLGERMARALEELFSRGVERAVLLGADVPTLPAARPREAMEALHEAEVVFGPAEDGGYYLVGIRRDAWKRAAPIFTGVAWSTARVLEQSLEIARRRRLSATLLPPWYDVDRWEDLERAGRDAEEGSALQRLLESAGWRSARSLSDRL